MYKMMTAKEVIDKLWSIPLCNRRLDFTFDDLDIEPDVTPTGWYGVQLTKIFDETECVLALGYWGGGSTEVYDIDKEAINGFHTSDESIKEFCAVKLQEFMNYWCGSDYGCQKICVEIEEG